jgi:hypothetical protein
MYEPFGGVTAKEFEAAVPYTTSFLTELWGRAQAAAGLPNTAATNANEIFNWHSQAGAGLQGAIVLNNDQMGYVRMYKCGTEMVEANLEASTLKEWTWPSSGDQPFVDDSRCWWTLVREPIGRFISAYTEFEFRFHEGETSGEGVDLNEMEGWSFQTLELGSKERAAAFIKDVLKVLWTINPHSGNHGNIGSPVSIFYNQAFSHMVPMSSTAWPYKFDFVGRLEREVMETEWNCMNTVCGTDVAYDGDQGQHPTSLDPFETKAGMEAALEEEPELNCALYMMLWPDFQNFDYPAPEGCAVLTDPNGSPASTRSVTAHPPGQSCGKSVDPLMLRPDQGASINMKFETGSTKHPSPPAAILLIVTGAIAFAVMVALVVVTHKRKANTSTPEVLASSGALRPPVDGVQCL